MPKRPPGQPRGDQRWSIFLKNHAKAILARDFFVAVTATFRMLYVFVVVEYGTRRLAHVNVTGHPSADWTLQQLREVIGDDHGRNKYLIHDCDRIFAAHLDDSIRALGVEVLRSPIASPKANSNTRLEQRSRALDLSARSPDRNTQLEYLRRTVRIVGQYVISACVNGRRTGKPAGRGGGRKLREAPRGAVMRRTRSPCRSGDGNADRQTQESATRRPRIARG
jgi:hypothetical protein